MLHDFSQLDLILDLHFLLGRHGVRRYWPITDALGKDGENIR